jgi:hypothetical protein
MEYEVIDKIINLISESADDKTLTRMIESIESEIIRRRGYNDGRNAGSWVFDGNMSAESIIAFSKRLDEGDPEALDALPNPRLGGEFADDPTWEQILKYEGIRYDSEVDLDGRADLEDVYRTAFDDGVRAEISETLQHLEAV